MHKRGQISFFIIVAVVLLVVFGFFYFFLIKPSTGNVTPEDISPIKTYVQLCLEKSIKDGLIYAGRNGGFIYFPDDTQWLKIDPDTKITVLYNNGRNKLPRLSEIERQMNFYIKERMLYCIDFSSFEKQGYAITEQGVKSANTTIMEDYTLAEIDYPITVKKNGESYSLEKFAATANVDFGRIYATVNQTLNNIAASDALNDPKFNALLAPHLNNSPGYSLKFILDSYPLDVRYAFVNDQTSVWSVSDNWDGARYMYNFAAVHILRGSSG